MAKNQRFGFKKASASDKGTADKMITDYQTFEKQNLKEPHPKTSFYISTTQWKEMLTKLTATRADGFKITPSLNIVKNGAVVAVQSLQLIVKPVVFRAESSFIDTDASTDFYWTMEINPVAEPPIVKIPKDN